MVLRFSPESSALFVKFWSMRTARSDRVGVLPHENVIAREGQGIKGMIKCWILACKLGKAGNEDVKKIKFFLYYKNMTGANGFLVAVRMKKHQSP